MLTDIKVFAFFLRGGSENRNPRFCALGVFSWGAGQGERAGGIRLLVLTVLARGLSSDDWLSVFTRRVVVPNKIAFCQFPLLSLFSPVS